LTIAPAKRQPAWSRSVLPLALAGGVLLWAALPNALSIRLGTIGTYFGWLGWIAPVPWLILIRLNGLPGHRPYRDLYLAGFAFWLAVLYWLSLPHWAVIPLWFLLAGYLAIYLPLFVSLSRVALHRFVLPLWLAAPIVWTGLELARAHLLTGFLMASLAHTQTHFAPLIQISDLVGEYGVDFMIVLVAACLVTAFRVTYCVDSGLANAQSAVRNGASNFRFRVSALIPAMIVLCTAVTYGYYRLGQSGPNARGPRVALIQGNSLAAWKSDKKREQQIMDDYSDLSTSAAAKARLDSGHALNLIVWPETMFREPLVTFDPHYELPPEAAQAGRTKQMISDYYERPLAAKVAQFGTPILVGIDRPYFVPARPDGVELPPQQFNSAVLVDRQGKVVSRYDKMHLVMFGEYVPFARWLPILNRISSLTGSVEAGAEPVALCTEGWCYLPNICYETAIPHVIRRQVAAIEARQQHIDALVNLTNDSWYWGSSGLDQHLDCGVFRAVESRLPLVIAANGGISAYIDSLGRIRAQAPRSQADVILADVELSGLQSPYVQFGDWFSGICLVFCVVFAASGWRSKRRLMKTTRPADDDPTT
jgi:apolipoprotein N-acyltransferase